MVITSPSPFSNLTVKPIHLLFFAVGAALLAGLFLLMKPQPPAPAAPAATVPSVAAPDAQPLSITPDPELRVEVEYRVEKGQRVAGPEVITLRQGNKLRLRILSDADDELHLHGYDQHTHIHAGKTSELNLTAEHSGRFEIELHKSHAQLGVLEVQPK